MKKEIETIVKITQTFNNEVVSIVSLPASKFDGYKAYKSTIPFDKYTQDAMGNNRLIKAEDVKYTYLFTVSLCEEIFDDEGEHVGSPRIIDEVLIHSNHISI